MAYKAPKPIGPALPRHPEYQAPHPGNVTKIAAPKAGTSGVARPASTSAPAVSQVPAQTVAARFSGFMRRQPV